MAADALTLESLGVDLDELARRIGVAQERAQRSDEDCAALAGVSVDRFRAWKDGRERPGVARMPKLAASVGVPVSWLMYAADALNPGEESDDDKAIGYARRAAALLAEAVPHVDALRRIAAEVHDDGMPLTGGTDLATVLDTVADRFKHADAIPTWRMDEAIAFRASRPLPEQGQ
jgi:transcriptional regulator with XRE-family HTH domain